MGAVNPNHTATSAKRLQPPVKYGIDPHLDQEFPAQRVCSHRILGVRLCHPQITSKSVTHVLGHFGCRSLRLMTLSARIKKPQYESSDRYDWDVIRPGDGRECGEGLAKGLTFRPLAVTAKGTLDSHKTRPAEERAGTLEGKINALSMKREAEVLTAWKEELAKRTR